MYKLQTTMLSICRHKRRNILSCLLLTSVISVIFCGCFYRCDRWRSGYVFVIRLKRGEIEL